MSMQPRYPTHTVSLQKISENCAKIIAVDAGREDAKSYYACIEQLLGTGILSCR